MNPFNPLVLTHLYNVPIALLVSISSVGLIHTHADAQVIPDSTLGTEQTQVLPNGTSVDGIAADLIQAGARRGENLFHSFDQFSIGEGQRVYFDNPTGIERILSRVTGSRRSDIEGTLGTLGTADVFLINPNGIVFGPNARLDVGGSFFVSTADAIQFDNQGFFSARNPESPSALLTIAPSAFFFSQPTPGVIESRSIANPSVADDVGLHVPNGETFLLLGGNVRVIGAGTVPGEGVQQSLSALGGRVEMGSVTGTGTVRLNENGSLTFPDGLERGRITLENAAGVNVASDSGGDIGVTARTVEIVFSDLNAGIKEGLGTTGSQAGDIVLDATERVSLTDESLVFNDVSSNSIGNGGDIRIFTGILSVVSGAQLSASTFGGGNAGSVMIEASDRITFAGTSSTGEFNSAAFSDAQPGAIGNGGSIEIVTRVLEVLNEAQLITSTFGEGNAGNVIIEASDRVTFDDGRAFSDVQRRGMGNSGGIEITTRVLEVLDGAQLITSTSGEGNAGNVIIEASDRISMDSGGIQDNATGIFARVFSRNAVGNSGNIVINTGALFVSNDAQITATTFGQGDSGNMIIEASDRIVFDERDSRGNFLTGDFLTGVFSRIGETGIGNGGNISISTPNLLLRNDAFIDTQVLRGGQGNGGNIAINTEILEVLDGALINTSTFGKGDSGDILIDASERISIERGIDEGGIFATSDSSGLGGDITINTNILTLDNDANILTDTLSTDGGNITLNLGDLLLLRNNSRISTEAGTARAGGNGGDISIGTRFIVAPSNENSDIVANAFEGNGGRIHITADGLFGIKPRPVLTIESDITASSAFGVDGIIEIQSPDVDLSQATVELPTAFVSPEVVRSCRATFAQSQSQFTISGRGGRPQNPADPLGAVALWQDILPIGAENVEREEQTTSRDEVRREAPRNTSHPTNPQPFVEAQGWIKQANGQVMLVADTQHQMTTNNTPLNAPVFCQA